MPAAIAVVDGFLLHKSDSGYLTSVPCVEMTACVKVNLSTMLGNISRIAFLRKTALRCQSQTKADGTMSFNENLVSVIPTFPSFASL